MKSQILAIVILILVMDSVKALSCYQCEYFEDSDVKYDNMTFEETCNSKFFVECPIISDVCFKVVAEGQDEKGKHISYTIRGCGIRAHFPGYDDLNKCEEKNSTELSGLVGYNLPDNFNGTVCLCSRDNCNSSSMLKVTKHLMFGVIGIFCSKWMSFY